MNDEMPEIVQRESPAWHDEALRETSGRRARGEEVLLDREESKVKLRHATP